MRRPRTSLKLKFLVPVMSIFIGALTAVSALFLSHQQTALEQSTVERGKATALSLGENLRRAVLDGDLVTLRASIAAVSSKFASYALILDDAQRVMAEVGASQEIVPIPEEALAALRGGAPVWTDENVNEAESVQDVVATVTADANERGKGRVEASDPTQAGTRIIGFVRIGIDRRAIHEQIAAFRSLVAPITLVFAVLAGVIMLLVVWLTVVRPIEAVRRAASSVAAGDLATRAQVTSRDEIGELAKDFNSMIEQVSHKSEELHSTAQLLNGILAGVSDSAVTALDMKGRIVTFNRGAEKVFQCQAHSMLGRPFTDLLMPAEHQRLTDTLSLTSVGSEVVERFEACRPDETGFPLLLTINLRTDSARQVVGYVAVGRDLTREEFERELLVRNKELEQASQAKSEFLANMSHELRTPLNAIIGFSELLHDGMLGELTEEQKSSAYSILDSGKHLLGLINEVLDLSKIEAGKMQMSMELVQVTEVVATAIAVARPLAEKKRLLLDEPSPSNLMVNADPVRLRQILLNLLSNAIKFTETGGSVIVRVRTERGMVGVEVEDNGIGIPADKLGGLFEKFQQLEDVHTKRYGGTGLGLALSRALTEMQGGTITVRSEEGRGSCFTVWLPKPPASGAPAATGNKQASGKA
jgi:PAS domain S-box-containing protein